MRAWRSLDRHGRQVFLALLGAAFLVGTGFGAIFAVLPLMVVGRGNTVATVAWMAGAYVVGTWAVQYPMGALADRIGRRPLLVAATAAHGLLGFVYVLPLGAPLLVLLRLGQGVANSGLGPSERALVADLVPDRHRAEAYGALSSADLAGFLAGPLIGGAIASVTRYEWVFVLQGLLGLAAALALHLLARDLPRPAPAAPRPPGARAGHWIGRDLVGLAILAAAGTYIYGMYDTVWVLFMHDLRASTLQIGLSFTLFGLPALLLATLGGRLGDTYGRRAPLVLGGLLTGVIAALYPFLPSISSILLLGVVEGSVLALVRPNQVALVAASAPAGMAARAQALVGSFSTLGVLPAAALSGWLYPVDRHLPFLAGAAWVMGAYLLGGLCLYWPRRAPAAAAA
ncbi:MAG: MFS transporter [Candidatus Dormibacteria bacterium]